MKYSISILGCGNMGTAIADGIIKEYDYPSFLTICDRHQEKIKKYKEIDIYTTNDINEAIKRSEIIFLCIEPKSIVELTPYTLELFKGKTIVSILAGLDSNYLRAKFTDAIIIRTMPNLALKYNSGITFIAEHTSNIIDIDVFNTVTDIFNHLGDVIILNEDMIDSFTALGASSPAFILFFVQSMIKSGINLGFKKEDSNKIVRNVFKGVSAILENDNRDINEIIDNICTPGGTTIEGINSLRKSTLEYEIDKALHETKNKSLYLKTHHS